MRKKSNDCICKDSRGEKNAKSHPSIAPTLHLQSLDFFHFCVLLN